MSLNCQKLQQESSGILGRAAANRGVGILVTLLLARFLVPVTIWLLAMMAVFIAIATALMDSGIQQAVIRKLEPNDAYLYTAFYTNLSLRSNSIHTAVYLGAHDLYLLRRNTSDTADSGSGYCCADQCLSSNTSCDAEPRSQLQNADEGQCTCCIYLWCCCRCHGLNRIWCLGIDQPDLT